MKVYNRGGMYLSKIYIDNSTVGYSATYSEFLYIKIIQSIIVYCVAKK